MTYRQQDNYQSSSDNAANTDNAANRQQYGQQDWQYTNSQQQYFNQQPQAQYARASAQQAYSGQQYAYTQGAVGSQTMNPQTSVAFEEAKHTSITRAYAEMTAGLLLTVVVAVITEMTGALTSFVSATGVLGWIGLAIIQVGLAVVLGWRITKMKTGTARFMFYLYAALMGFTLSSVFATYNLGSIGLAFALTIGFFVVLTMLSLTTKLDMLKAGPILLVALITLIIGEVIMMFVAPTQTTMMVIAAIGLIIFAGYTAYDAQMTRALFAQYANQPEMVKKVSIICALNLYLDFVNMFLYLLQLLGDNN